MNWVILNQAKLLDWKRLEDKLYEIPDREIRVIKLEYCKLILGKRKY